MFLTDAEIEQAQLISPFRREQLNPHGYDLTLSTDFAILDPHFTLTIDTREPSTRGWLYIHDKEIEIPPAGFALALTEETLRLPEDITGICFGRSSLARVGVLPHVTPIDAGFRGRLVIEISNTAPNYVRLYAGTRIVQVLFVRSKPARVPYKGRYQDQKTLMLSKGI